MLFRSVSVARVTPTLVGEFQLMISGVFLPHRILITNFFHRDGQNVMPPRLPRGLFKKPSAPTVAVDAFFVGRARRARLELSWLVSVRLGVFCRAVGVAKARVGDHH